MRVEAATPDVREDGEQNCCIGCFRLLPLPQESPQEDHEPELLCVSCILLCKSSTSPVVHSVGGVLSPLPKLSLLVKAEAKCQDQLQLLRSQQESLSQQRESLQATRRAKEEALTAERELARQRRRHFLLIQERRKREEELKYQQFQVEDHTTCRRSEQEASADKPNKKRPKPPKVDISLQRQASERLDATDVALPYVVEPMIKHAETPNSRANMNNADSSSAEAHSASLWERRRQVMACYSQDLSPLIEGCKPRRLPIPKTTAVIAPSSIVKRRQTPDNNAQTMTIRRHKNQQNTHKQGKSPAPKTMKLRPLVEQKRYTIARPQQQNSSNQFDDFHQRAIPFPLTLQPPRRLIDHSGPLTAEIKPVSWAYELTKDGLPQDDTHEFTGDEAGRLGFSVPLYPVAEDDGGPQFTMFPLQHQLPNPTFPPSKLEPPVEAAAKAPRWEYSAERLSSLLEKYNVSVSTATPATTAPNL